MFDGVGNRLLSRLEMIAVDALDHHEFRARADRVLRRAIGYDIAAWASVDPSTHLHTSCDVYAAFGDPPKEVEREQRLLTIEFADADPLTYAKMIRAGRTAGRLRAEVEDPDTVERFREVLAPAGAFDEMRVVLRDSTGVWGALSLGRAEWWEPFDQRAEDLVASVAPALAAAFRHAFLVSALGTGDRPPGAFTIDTRATLLATSEPAERWLDTLSEEQLRGTLASLLAALRSRPVARATVVGRGGPVTLHAFPRKGAGGGETEVVIERPRPAELAEVIMAAHGLTPREAQVTRLVLQGLTTRAMANELGISEYTVQDHLKSIFGKVGVVTRGELLEAIYSRHYHPRREADVTPGPYGFFVN